MRRTRAAYIAAFLFPAVILAQNGAMVRQANAARQALAAGQYAEAVRLYRELSRELPNEPGLHLNLGIALEKAGQPSAAIPELEVVTRAEPNLSGGWFLLGLAYAQLNRPAKAIPPLREAVRLDSSNADALLELADAELEADETQASAEHFEALARLHPDSSKAWEGMGLARLRQSDDAAAAVTKQAPNSAYALALEAGQRAARGEIEEALRLYGEALRTNPDLPGVHRARARLYRELGRVDLASREELQQTDENDPAAALARGSETRSLHDLYAAAIAAGELAEANFARLEQLPPSPESHAILAEHYQRTGRRLEAVREWKKALELDPDNARVRANLAESLYRAREYGDAEALIRPLSAAHPENADWQYLLGSILFNQKRIEDALPHLLRAAQLEPTFLPVWQNLGLSYLDLNQLEKAVDCLSKALPLDNGSISFALATAYRRLGRFDEARASLEHYKAITKREEFPPAP